jgi:hypothetical protein
VGLKRRLANIFSNREITLFVLVDRQEKKKMGHFGTLWDICRLNLQTIQTPNQESNPKQAYPKIALRVFFFFCTLFRKYSLNQPAFL